MKTPDLIDLKREEIRADEFPPPTLMKYSASTFISRDRKVNDVITTADEFILITVEIVCWSAVLSGDGVMLITFTNVR